MPRWWRCSKKPRKSRPDDQCLTTIGRSVVEAECDRWLHQEIGRYKFGILGVMNGREFVEQEARLAVAEAMAYWRPWEYPGVPFGVFARQKVRWKMDRLCLRAKQRAKVWRQMPEVERSLYKSSALDNGNLVMKRSLSEMTLRDPVCHRKEDRDMALAAWCGDDYAGQRKCLDWRSRLVLCLVCVEGYTQEEVGTTLGITRSRVQQLVYRAAKKMAEWRTKHRKAA